MVPEFGSMLRQTRDSGPLGLSVENIPELGTRILASFDRIGLVVVPIAAHGVLDLQELLLFLAFAVLDEVLDRIVLVIFAVL